MAGKKREAEADIEAGRMHHFDHMEDRWSFLIPKIESWRGITARAGLRPSLALVLVDPTEHGGSVGDRPEQFAFDGLGRRPARAAFEF